MRPGFYCLSLSLFLFLLPGSRSLADAPPYTASVFRSIEARFDDVQPFRKWVAMLERMLVQRPQLESKGCGFGTNEPCGAYYWRNFVREIEKDPPLAKLSKVHAYLNAFPYVTDFSNWGIADFWETPLEFLEKHGDCEDYAIIKYVTLKRLGFDPARMRILAVDDLSLGTAHAVLMLEDAGKTYILDNQLKQVTEAKTILHYRAVYSINESFWWKHIYN